MDKMRRLSEAIKALMESEFSGYIKINFSQGSLGRIEKSEEFENAAILLMGKNCDSKKHEGAEAGHETLRFLPAVLLASFIVTGCAAGLVKQTQPVNASDAGKVRVVRAGDIADVHYLCRLKTGDVVAATDPFPEKQLKSNIYLQQQVGPLPIAAVSAADAERGKGGAIVQRSLEEEILHKLAAEIVGMKEGSKRETEIKAEDMPAQAASQYMARLTRVRTRPKEMKMPKGDYIYLTHGTDPAVGQAYTYDPDFPGTVESVSDTEVTIRFFATPGAILSTPFGPGRIKEEGPDYRIDIDARKGALVRTAGMVGRISAVDEKAITVDFSNPFGGETLLCDVTVDKIADAKLARGGE
jgi:FKBP-type peptidyl-prolyl cis-trans isomerase 2